mmetsp:Transcript_31715/g.80715  ORF Transcript_31715/g.80715 Transcript_31715/m.80715 type:complete len:336 (+) Transcript_31715:2495-3502(+)
MLRPLSPPPRDTADRRTIPDGWVMMEDLDGNFNLVSEEDIPESFRTLMPEEDGNLAPPGYEVIHHAGQSPYLHRVRAGPPRPRGSGRGGGAAVRLPTPEWSEDFKNLLTSTSRFSPVMGCLGSLAHVLDPDNEHPQLRLESIANMMCPLSGVPVTTLPQHGAPGTATQLTSCLAVAKEVWAVDPTLRERAPDGVKPCGFALYRLLQACGEVLRLEKSLDVVVAQLAGEGEGFTNNSTGSSSADTFSDREMYSMIRKYKDAYPHTNMDATMIVGPYSLKAVDRSIKNGEISASVTLSKAHCFRRPTANSSSGAALPTRFHRPETAVESDGEPISLL